MIEGVKDDDWSRKWNMAIQEFVTDYNDIRHNVRGFHQNYLKNTEFGEMWRAGFEALVRMASKKFSSVDEVIQLLEQAKKVIDTAGDVLENLIVCSVRDIDHEIGAAIGIRAVAIEAVREEMDSRFKIFHGNIWRWNDYIWSDTW